MNDPRNLLTQEEHFRFGLALAIIAGPHIRQFTHSFSDYAMGLLPTVRLEQAVAKLGARTFAQRLLNATLDIYHDASEWLGLCYGIALALDEAREVIIYYLLMGPLDHRPFISKVLNEIEQEMSEQIAVDFVSTPFTLLDRQSTRTLFAEVYGQTLLKIALIKDTVARRRLLL